MQQQRVRTTVSDNRELYKFTPPAVGKCLTRPTIPVEWQMMADVLVEICWCQLLSNWGAAL